MIFYIYVINAIIGEPIKNRSESELTSTYKRTLDYLVERGLKPKVHWFDNETIPVILNYDKNNMITWQLTPLNIHRDNADERFIRTWKNHFISFLSRTNPNLPLYLWDRLIDQSNISLNLLRKSRINQNLSAYQELEGILDYNKTPLFPPGSQVLIYEKVEKRHTWGPRRLLGCYIGTELNQYRFLKLYITQQSLREFQNLST